MDDNVSLIARDGSQIVLGEKNIIHGNGSIIARFGSEIHIGNDGNFGRNLSIDLSYQSSVSIGDGCLYSYFIKMRGDDGHTILDLKNKKVHERKKNIVIGDHVWVGMGATILPGSRVGSGCVIGADALVNHEFGANQMLVGVPAKVLRENVDWNNAPDISYEDYSNK